MGEVDQMFPRYVRDLMTVGVATCSPETAIGEVARQLLDGGLESLVVLEDGHALGVVTQKEVVRAFACGEYRQLTAMDIMQEGVQQIPPDIPLSAAAQLMLDQGLRTVYLMHHAAGVSYPAAMLTYKHLLRLVAAQDAAQLGDLGIHAQREKPLDGFLRRREAQRDKNKEGGLPATKP